MTGWSGGVANRTWKRDARGSDDGRLGLAADIAAILRKFRDEHGYEPGMAWNPFTGRYEWPQPGKES
jgi:hypothetical protein